MCCPMSDIDGMVIGGHSDKGMLPLTRFSLQEILLEYQNFYQKNDC